MTRRRPILAALVGVVAGAVPAATSLGQGLNDVPAELQGVDIIEHLDASIPLDLTFTDDTGKEVKLGDYFHKDRPVMLQLGYLRCPMLCNLVLNGAIDGLKQVDWNAGEEFELVSVSINPRETHDLAKVKKEGYLIEYGRPKSANGFHFLTGPESSSHTLADAVGFKFREQSNGDYAHAAAIFLITPDVRVSRYLYGTKFSPKDLRFGLLEASEGKIGSTLDRFILWCHVYDPNAKGYVLMAMRIMQLGGVATLLVLGGGLAILWRQEVKRRRNAGQGAPSASLVPSDPSTPLS